MCPSLCWLPTTWELSYDRTRWAAQAITMQDKGKTSTYNAEAVIVLRSKRAVQRYPIPR